MVLPTLFSAHAPAAQHRARREAAGMPAPAVTLSPLDAFVLTRLAAYVPHPLTVLDLAADATDGDSVAVLHAAGVSVVSPRLSWAPQVRTDWRPFVREERPVRNGVRGAEALTSTAPLTLLDAPADDDGDAWREVTRALPIGGTTLVLLAETAETAPHTGEHLAWLAKRLPEAPVLLLPLGATGEGELLPQALSACPSGGTRRFVALRERAPFFATSDLGVIFPANDTVIPVALERLAALVTGNFQFLPLVRDAVTAATRITALETELGRVREVLAMTEEARAATEAARAATESARAQADASRAAAEQLFAEKTQQANAADEEAAQLLMEKTQYAEWLESRLVYLEEEYLPWKNTVLAGLETEVRNLYSSKALRAERLIRKIFVR